MNSTSGGAASLLLRDHGYDAPLIAAQRRDALLAAGDTNGTIIWKCIMTAIDESHAHPRRRRAAELSEARR